MNKSEEIADGIIKDAYRNGGSIDYDSISTKIAADDLPQVNMILEEYGSLEIPLEDGTWFSYSLNQRGNVFASQGSFKGLEQERKEKAKDRKLDRLSKKISIIAVIISVISLFVSIIALCSKQ
ncbi:hypothetical protein [Bacteroides ihuae]|uniref:hypothetical protein n=1 Tax=Bacteroides ihuae TaxID=1852362 RepID=UPI0008DAA799|nr:hypothetical protein [Bacteroides ihuae]